MNICLITSSFPSHSGDYLQAPFIIDFIYGLQRRGHNVFVFTQDREGGKEKFLGDVRIKWFPWMKTNRPLVKLNPYHPLDVMLIVNLFLKGRKEILPFIRENQIQVCLALWVIPSGYFANYLYRKTGVPYSVWALGSDIYYLGKNPFLRPLMKRILTEAKNVFADGFDLTRKIEKMFDRKCEYLPTSRKISNAYPEKGDRGEVSHQCYHFLYIGRLEKVKGIDILIKAASLLNEERYPFHLTVVGKGTMEKWAKRYIHEKKIEDKVTFSGTISDRELAFIYKNSDCVIIPSRSESIPLVFSEAINFNKDMIVTEVGDMGELARKYRVADVIPPENPIALKEAMKRKILFSKEEKMNSRRIELLKIFDIETSVEKFLENCY